MYRRKGVVFVEEKAVMSGFKKRKDLLICVDSDGCAINSMEYRHRRCFGPVLVKEWSLGRWEKQVLGLWNRINLYSMNRGVNRFRGLAIALKEINETIQPIGGVGHLLYWVERADELSNSSLQREIESNPDVQIYKKALSWSEEVNRMSEQAEGIVPFEGVAEALAQAKGYADIAVVSGADPATLEREWEVGNISQYADVFLAQNAGSKPYCLSELLGLGYEKERVLMCGDAIGDLSAAEENGVFFYPILAGREAESWAVFHEVLPRLVSGDYKEYGEKLKKQFIDNLKGENNDRS